MIQKMTSNESSVHKKPLGMTLSHRRPLEGQPKISKRSDVHTMPPEGFLSVEDLQKDFYS